MIAFDYKRMREGKDPDQILLAGDIVEMQASEPRTRTDWLSILPTVLSAAVLFRR